jgi:hypothetical protein
MNINGATGAGGGGNPDLVSGGAPTNGSQAKASGTTSSDAITFQAPTGGSGSSTPSAALAHVVGSGASLSGSGLGPYTVNSLEDADVVTVTCTHTDDGDGQVVKDVAVVDVAAAGASGAAWTTVLEIDFTTDITDLTLTRAAGDTILYEADATTPKATLTFATRTGTAGGSAVVTAAAGGLLLTTTGSGGAAQFVTVEIPEGAGIDFDDGKLYAVDIITDQRVNAANTAFILTGVGNNASGVNSGYNVVHRSQRVSASDWTHSARTRRGSTSDVGATLTSDTTQEDAMTARIIVDRGGDLLDLYFTKGSTYLAAGDPRPVTGAALWNGAGGTAVINTDDKDRFSGASAYLLLDHQVYGGTMTTRVTKLRIQRLD